MTAPLLRHARTLAALLAVCVSFVGIFGHGLWTPDEPREAEVGREMWLAGGSAVPTLGGRPFLEKPPLHPWSMAASFEVFGVSHPAARLPSALCAIGSLLVAFHLGRRAGGRLAGLLSSAVLASTQGFALASHKAMTDNLLAFFVALGHLAAFELRERQRLGQPARGPLTLLACASGLAFLTKGAIGPILLLAPPFLAAVALREWGFAGRLLRGASVACLSGVLLLGFPWVLWVGTTHGWELVRICLIDNTIGRSSATSVDALQLGHARGPLYYLGALPFTTLPWIVLLPFALTARTCARGWHAGRTRFLGALALAGVLILSIPATKRDLYLLPLLPALSVVVGVWLAHVGSSRRLRRERVALVVLMVAFGVLSLAGAWIGFGLPAPEEIGELRAAHPLGWVLLGLGFLVLALFALRFVTRFRQARAGARVAGLAVGFLLSFLVGVMPLLDPVKDLSTGAIEIGRAVPEGEPLLALRPDETTRAIVPFYTGRMLEPIHEPAEVLERLEALGARHLILEERRQKLLTPELLARLELAHTISLSPTRSVVVYRLR